MKEKIIPAVVVIVIAVAVAWFAFGTGGRKAESLDAFATCLTDKQFVMYGAYWCSHCANEKKAFGPAFEKVNYVECTEDSKKCTDAGVKGFPTWMAPNGIFLEGEQGIEKLSEVSGCQLPNK